jgi:hypothetical protein
MPSMRKNTIYAMVVVCAAGLVASTPPVQAKDEGHGWNLSIGANKNADAKDVGLPVYPGARPHRDKDDDDSSANVWALLGGAGFKVAVVKLESDDGPGKVAAFYRPALAKYGPVLDCSGRSAAAHGHDWDQDKLDCDEGQPKPGEMLFKAGKNHDQHIVSIRPRGNGSVINLVFLRITGFD